MAAVTTAADNKRTAAGSSSDGNGATATASSQSSLRHSIAGATAGCMSSLIMCPLDVAKTKLQNQGAAVGTGHYRGTIGTLRTILIEEGPRGWYRGLSASLMGYLPNWAIYFTTYDLFKTFVAEDLHIGSIDDPRTHILAAMSAGILSTVSTNPLWVIKTRLMSKDTSLPYKGIADAFVRIVRNETWHGLYRGLGPSLLGVSHVAVQFPLYEYLKTHFTHKEQERLHRTDVILSPFYILLSSATSKVVASCCTYPHEVLRTRLHNQTTLKAHSKYTGIVNTARVVINEEGLRALYKGLGTNLLRVTPAGMITFLTYELVIRNLDETLI